MNEATSSLTRADGKEVIADVVGHEKGNFTLDTYSGGSSMAQKREAIAKLTYPAPLDRP